MQDCTVTYSTLLAIPNMIWSNKVNDFISTISAQEVIDIADSYEEAARLWYAWKREC